MQRLNGMSLVKVTKIDSGENCQLSIASTNKQSEKGLTKRLHLGSMAGRCRKNTINFVPIQPKEAGPQQKLEPFAVMTFSVPITGGNKGET